MKQPVSDPSVSKNHISSIRSKTGRRKNSGRPSFPWLNLGAYTDITPNTNSPYYKGLTDQSLAIVDAIPQPQPQLHSPSTDLLSSPYYKGLTDYSLVINPWTPHNHPIPFSYPSSPYYKGLLTADYTLVLHAHTIKTHHTHHPSSSFMVDPHLHFLTQPLDHQVQEMVIEERPSVEDESMDVIQEKPLRERVSETSHLNLVDMDASHYTWATKYQPITLEDFICNQDKALHLKAMVKEGCGCNHFIFEGPPSVGKRSMIRAMLREVFGAHRVQVKEEYRYFNLKGEMVDNVKVCVKKSMHHVEVNLSETKGYEKHVIVDLFKETHGQVINNWQPCFPENCKAIILYEAEKLSIESLLYIKWLLEKYKGCNKVFFCCSDESKLQSVKPLCITVRLSSPSTQELVKILENIGKEEGIELSRNLLEKIILRSKNNLRQAIRSLEATCRNKDAVEDDDDDLILTGWEEDILNMAKKITQEQSPRQLYVIRRKLLSIMRHDLPPDFIYKRLVTEITNLVDESLRAGVAKLDKEFIRPSFEVKQYGGHPQNKQPHWDDNNNDSTKKNMLTYLKVEEFIAKFMSWYKNSIEKGNQQ